MKIFTSTQAHETAEAPYSVETSTYYTERKITPKEFRSEFGRGYALKRGQKLITVRDYKSKAQASKMLAAGATLIMKN